jgi:hypothetical protein
MLTYQSIQTATGAAVCHASPFGGYVLDVDCPSIEAATKEAARMNREYRLHIERFNRDTTARIERRAVRFFPTERGD